MPDNRPVALAVLRYQKWRNLYVVFKAGDVFGRIRFIVVTKFPIQTPKRKTRPSILHHLGELLFGTSHQSILTFDCEECQSSRLSKCNIAHMVHRKQISIVMPLTQCGIQPNAELLNAIPIWYLDPPTVRL